MDTGIESIGEAVTGGLAARAVEPAAGEPHGDAGICLNCGSTLLGEFCHRCGQAAHVHRTLSAFGHDLLHGVLHFEGKIWRTLPMLAWHPGQLTRRYVEGERANFVSPLALFLFSVFLMFAAVNWIGTPFHGSSISQPPAEQRAEALREFNKAQAESQAELAALGKKLEQTKAAGESTSDVEQEIKGVQLEIRLQKQALALSTRLADDEEARDRRESERDARQTAEEAAKANADATPTPAGASTDDFVGIDGLPPSLHFLETGFNKAKENPKLLLYKLQSNAYKLSWALIPISLPFVWVLFLHRRRYRRQYKAYDHIVFVTYSIAFMSLGFIVLTILGPLKIGPAIAGFAILLVPPIHIYRQLRGAYSLSRFSAAWRTAMLLFFTSISATLFLSLLLVLGLLG